ncbi:hypothetical protein [Thiovibrio frasassiensis]|jgi:hypothetical protein|uniref:Flavodoxin-like domain-containing protein n=1 Tax=Thiovibrio frasassiensis TaxID=2984131 RepID=A0A9X4MF22_9BACT|nr:hypothetical protein [Thiovibrio frasassiensis]MDG4475113.1 hypothetical protein [Thiovibrio frasassiensis]
MQPADAKSMKVLILYYSFSAQTSGLVHRLGAGLEAQGVEVVCERLQPLEPRHFPIGTVVATLVMMLTTFLRGRIPIQPLPASCWEHYDLIVLAGPTWSYNPSGPVLSLLDRDGARLFAGQQVLPLISCRGYWRMHWLGLRFQLQRLGAVVVNRMVFAHPTKEPWRTIGVFLKLAGRVPERSGWLARYYPRYGHSREQQEEAFAFGAAIGQALKRGHSLAELALISGRAGQPGA